MTANIEENIRNIRELKNFTQEFMANELGMSQASYSKIEKGSTVLTYTKLVNIAAVLNVKVEDILNFNRVSFFNGFDSSKGSTITTESTEANAIIKKLYEDKISLLERLLLRTEEQLSLYKAKYGDLK
ncbi:MAG: helix-turn-helix transcriptional regulator [Bacteroidota bacterium]